MWRNKSILKKAFDSLTTRQDNLVSGEGDEGCQPSTEQCLVFEIRYQTCLLESSIMMVLTRSLRSLLVVEAY